MTSSNVMFDRKSALLLAIDYFQGICLILLWKKTERLKVVLCVFSEILYQQKRVGV